MRTVRALAITTMMLGVLTGCARDADAPLSVEAMQPALASITEEDLLRRTRDLAHDSMEGRLPGTVGEERTVRYLVERFRALGLAPGNPDGTYVQSVPLVGITPRATASLEIGGRRVPLRGRLDFIAQSRRVAREVSVTQSDLVFVGYGVVAPEYGWDDFKDVDVTGKTVVMLVNDPPVTVPGGEALDESMFGGRAMTYYGRWTYKYEIAGARGAAAAIIIHETGPAGYPFEVLSAGFENEGFDVKSPDDNLSRIAVQAWIPEPAARRLLRQMGHDFDELKGRSVAPDFRPVDLGARVSFRLTQQDP